MKDRHQVLNDRQFWEKLEFVASHWLENSVDKNLRKYWIDGFLPDTITNTKSGVDVEGIVWVGEGSRNQHQYRFIAAIPQKMLHHRMCDFIIEMLSFDEEQQTLKIGIRKE